MASPTSMLHVTPTTTTPKPLLLPIHSKHTTPSSSTTTTTHRRTFLSLSAVIALSTITASIPAAAWAASDEEYTKETQEVIAKVRTTINMDKTDPNIAAAVAELRETSNSWVAKYRREKSLLGRLSFRDMYSALNAVSGHYVSFGPTSPIPAKRKTRILEEMDSAEKALLRGR
ncbi:photosystem II repair protein PSB27-H1, chloroplastic-like [Bidens hawaiensis]|uniref:photosystem II repair protein PSB27-H1, chloroplastic-like n=1 Tax=Bidens hawaiensis TaxID=980011 RepID=UPI0040495C3C